MDTRATPIAAAAASRDAHLTLRRVDRQQRMVAVLARSGRRWTLQELAQEFGVAARTIARDVQRLRHSGVPVDIIMGRSGGVSLRAAPNLPPVHLEVSEIAALLASLAAVGPMAGESAESAMMKLAAALSGRLPTDR